MTFPERALRAVVNRTQWKRMIHGADTGGSRNWSWGHTPCPLSFSPPPFASLLPFSPLPSNPSLFSFPLLSPSFSLLPPPSLFLLPCLLAQLVGLRELTKLSRRGRRRIFDHFDSWKVKTLLLTADLVFLMLVLTIYLLKANKDSKKILYCPNNYYKLSNAHQPMHNPATTKWLMTV